MIPVILNPAARSMRSGGWRSKIEALSSRVEIRETRAPGHARELARDLAACGTPVVVAAGGDGTVNEVVSGLMEGGLENGTALGVLPTGTMNVFAAELGIPGTHRLEKCWRIIERDQVREIDLWRANERCFVQLAGVGLDAEAIRETSWEQKKKLGPLSYVVSAARIMSGRPAHILVRHPAGADVEGVMVLIGSGKRYGGPFKLFPDALNTDGLLDVIVLKEANYLDLLVMFAAASVHGFENVAEVDYFQCASLEVVALDPESRPVAAQVDGDLAGHTPVTISRAPVRLRVVAPAP